MADTTPSTDGGQAPTSGSPQAGATSTTDGQAPVSQTQPTDHEKIIEQLRKENAAARKRLDAFEQAQKEADLAKLSETEKLTAQHSELQAKHAELERRYQERVISSEVQVQASALGIVHPEKVYRLIDTSELEFDDDGMPTNAKALIEKLLKEMPELAGEKQQSPAQQQQQKPPAVPAMNPGRSSIQQPGQGTPGRIPGWHEVYKRP